MFDSFIFETNKMYKFSPTIFYIYVSTWIFTILKFILICKSCYLTLRRASENLTVTLKWAKKYFCWKRSGSLCQGECLFRFFLKLWSKRRYLQMFWKIFFFKGPGDLKKKKTLPCVCIVHCARPKTQIFWIFCIRRFIIWQSSDHFHGHWRFLSRGLCLRCFRALSFWIVDFECHRRLWQRKLLLEEVETAKL